MSKMVRFEGMLGLLDEDRSGVVERDWASRVHDGLQGLVSEPSEQVSVPLQVEDVQEQYEDGYSTTPHGCRVELPATQCEHGQESWASILGMSDEE